MANSVLVVLICITKMKCFLVVFNTLLVWCFSHHSVLEMTRFLAFWSSEGLFMHLKLWLLYITTAFLQQILLSHQWGKGREIYLSRNLIIS